MKRISFLLLSLALWAVPAAHAQDAATEQRLNQLSGKIDDLQASEDALKTRVKELTTELNSAREQISSLREQISKQPTGTFVTPDDLKKAIAQVDANRKSDNDAVRKELDNLRRDILAALQKATTPGRTVPPPPVDNGSGTTVGTAKYKIQDGDTLDKISNAYKSQHNMKVTVEQILSANPGLDPKKLRVGQEINIPLPTSTTSTPASAPSRSTP